MRRPIRIPFPLFLSPHQLFRRLRRRYPNSFLLESRSGPRRLARYSLIGAGPKEFFRDTRAADPTVLARDVIHQHRLPSVAGFGGGLVGAIGYDAAFHFLPTGLPPRAPTYLLGLYLDAIVFDHLHGRVYYSTTGEDRSEEFREAAERSEPGPVPLRRGRMRSSTTQDEFEEGVRTIQRRIRDGDTYQTVLSRRLTAPVTGDSDALYERLRDANPSPYMYHLAFGDTEILGSSPEMLVRVEHDTIETYPIAGTRPRGATTSEDRALVRELTSDPKENAEHLMLVDLARNDVGRVAATGTVRVPRFRRIESYANVHHLVSHVTGRLAKGRTSLDAFRSLFPAGTVSGAPKIRAMQILHRLEARPRGFYAGAVGRFGFNGDVDAAITIRTAVIQGNELQVQAGAGIVQDSVPAREFEETRHKADAILRNVEGPR